MSIWRRYFRAPRDTGDNGWYQERKRPTHSKLINDTHALGRSCDRPRSKLRAVE